MALGISDPSSYGAGNLNNLNNLNGQIVYLGDQLVHENPWTPWPKAKPKGWRPERPDEYRKVEEGISRKPNEPTLYLYVDESLDHYVPTGHTPWRVTEDRDGTLTLLNEDFGEMTAKPEDIRTSPKTTAKAEQAVGRT